VISVLGIALVNSTNILQAAFLPIFFTRNIQGQIVCADKLCKTLLFLKAAIHNQIGINFLSKLVTIFIAFLPWLLETTLI